MNEEEIIEEESAEEPQEVEEADEESAKIAGPMPPGTM